MIIVGRFANFEAVEITTSNFIHTGRLPKAKLKSTIIIYLPMYHRRKKNVHFLYIIKMFWIKTDIAQVERSNVCL